MHVTLSKCPGSRRFENCKQLKHLLYSRSPEPGAAFVFDDRRIVSATAQEAARDPSTVCAALSSLSINL